MTDNFYLTIAALVGMVSGSAMIFLLCLPLKRWRFWAVLIIVELLLTIARSKGIYDGKRMKPAESTQQ